MASNFKGFFLLVFFYVFFFPQIDQSIIKIFTHLISFAATMTPPQTQIYPGDNYHSCCWSSSCQRPVSNRPRKGHILKSNTAGSILPHDASTQFKCIRPHFLFLLRAYVSSDIRMRSASPPLVYLSQSQPLTRTLDVSLVFCAVLDSRVGSLPVSNRCGTSQS